VGWARRAAAHPHVLAALAEGTVLTESMARAICGWTGKLPESGRDAADEILLGAVAGGALPGDLAALAAEIYARTLPDQEDDDLLPDFEDRRVRLETTLGGAGVISGDLTPECAAVVQTVLDALAAPAGAQDIRTKDQRFHDALHDAMRRLVAAGLLPERAGQPVKVWAHVSLAELRALDDGSILQQEWIGEMAVRWAAASQTGSDGAAWLTGKAARAVACDASVIPVVTGQIDPGAQTEGHSAGGTGVAGPRPPASAGLEMLRHAIIGKAVDLVSGPGGLAGFLRTRLLGARLAGPSLPLDVGPSADIPAAIRRAVILRDQHCRWVGGCDQPASACEVHHVTHLADGGTTSVDGCALYCFFHHHVAIHQRGWTVTLNPDGTTTARSPDGTKVFHSHGTPDRPLRVARARLAGMWSMCRFSGPDQPGCMSSPVAMLPACLITSACRLATSRRRVPSIWAPSPRSGCARRCASRTATPSRSAWPTGEETRELHVAFTAPDRAAVDAVHQAAVAAGVEVLHAPREWPEYHPGYYAVFVRDPDGHNVEAVHHG
jgi:catechol 2,3-dioxygenase-like lactoylglutathione lyase family enzyme